MVLHSFNLRRCLIVAFVLAILLFILMLLLPKPVQAGNGPNSGQPGTWYRVKRGDTWQKLSRRSGNTVKMLQKANPRHIHRAKRLIPGHKLWAPTPVACPGDYSEYGAIIETYLNKKGATPARLRKWLQNCGVMDGTLGGVSGYALRDVKEGDLVVVIHDLPAAFVMPSGTLLVFHDMGTHYVLAHEQRPGGKIEVLDVGDITGDGRREITWTATDCGAHTCFSTLYVEQWDGMSYRDWIVGMPTMASAAYSINSSGTALMGNEIVVHGGLIGSVGAGPQRASSEVYFHGADTPYYLLWKVYDDSGCLYHHVLDANEAYDRADVEGYGLAIMLYEALLADTTLQACAPFIWEDVAPAEYELPNELEALRDFARFRLVVAYSIEGNSGGAANAYSQLTTSPFIGAADTFLTSYASSSDPVAACSDVWVYALAIPATWTFLLDWGYANPTFSAEALCSGAASIHGVVWADRCTIPDGGSLPPSPGCVPSGSGYSANGVREAGELGIYDIAVNLLSGTCATVGVPIENSTLTEIDGEYRFSGLISADYCVEILLASADNTEILIPGSWTAPTSGDAGGNMRYDVTLSPGQMLQGLDFGWDYQFD
ncbi:MAG: LysM peptidoglycan-binding domain-containing protein [Chloroflexi bacterium]|nr:LysM peptidoglycan-binding domain-containing protein [Chloroflexota bacterium]